MHIVIVGGGFTGTLVAAHLAQQPAVLRGTCQVTLVERTAALARGIAYATPYPSHVLNVPAHNMAAFPHAPDDLLRWLATQPEAAAAGELSAELAGAAVLGSLRDRFVPRLTYGRYLESLWIQARTGGVRHLQASVEGLTPGPEGFTVHLDAGRTLQADRVALCLGHLPPTMPPVPGSAKLGLPHLVANAWQWHDLQALDPRGDVCLLGTGLTAVDVVLMLRERGFSGQITAVSRHGLAPQAHALNLAKLAAPSLPTHSAAALLRHVRDAAKARMQAGGDWREAVDALRASTPALWQALAPRHQRQLLRHVKSFWDVHRHRIAPQVAEQLRAEQAAGRLRIVAGRLLGVQLVGQQTLEVQLRRRHDGSQQVVQVQHLVNCTGGSADWRKSKMPLLQGLLAQQLAAPDPHGLGVQADAQGRMRNPSGGVTAGLFVAGPALVGRDFESVAVPELRLQAAQLAQQLVV
jgi:uncharacterized NAD(P)/FAD-binding protein YdhS